LASQLEERTGLEARVSILGYVQRGGTPNAADRLLGTRLGVAGSAAIADGSFGVMVGDRGSQGTELVPLKRVAGKVKYVPEDHEWIQAARAVGPALGDCARVRRSHQRPQTRSRPRHGRLTVPGPPLSPRSGHPDREIGTSCSPAMLSSVVRRAEVGRDRWHREILSA
ncbi:6-phosphofructokinase, partial [Actinomyces radicidentis]|uniref:6-phosphofructokinase n=1 Tax=Actinomyces radicidentis TaxID=111015 RepID=UPI0026DEB486